MNEERTLGCVIEAVGIIHWPNPPEGWNEPQVCARLLDDEGFRHVITSSQCFRNGTVLNADVVGERGTIGLVNCSVVWFNCPTLGRQSQKGQ